MFKTVLAAAAVLTPAFVPAVVLANETREFSHEGTNYSYTAEQKGDATVIAGTSSSGAPFRLVVKGDRVSGTYNNRYVSFSKAEAAKTSLTK